MGELVVVTGPPGAGKSAVARELAELFEPSALVPGDEFFGFVQRGYIAPWLSEAHQQNTAVIESAAAAAGRLTSLGTVVYDGVVGPWFLSTFAKRTGLPSVFYVVLLPTLETCVERVRTRTGHGFTDIRVTRDMHARFADAEIEPRHVISEADNPAALAGHIDAQLATGRFDYPGR